MKEKEEDDVGDEDDRKRKYKTSFIFHVGL